jgi:hypothetical protein
MTERKGWQIRSTAHYIAHREVHRVATSNARKVFKVVRYLPGINPKLVRDTAYRSTYEEIYPDRFQAEVIDLVLQNAAKDASDRLAHLTSEDCTPAINAGRDLKALFRLDDPDGIR